VTTVQSTVPARPQHHWAKWFAVLACPLAATHLLGMHSAAGADVWNFSGPGGGPVHALVLDPTNLDILYAGTEDGGVFKSTDGGVSWGAANGGLPARAPVYALAIDTATLYAGTHGAGVFRSPDAGGVWQAVNSGLGSFDVNALAEDPAAPATLYAGTKTGVYTSTDGGTHWEAADAELQNIEVNSLVADPVTPTTFYAATQGAGVFKTTDGVHWQAAENAPRYVNALAIDPMAPAIVFAAASDALGGVFKSTDGGARWFSASAGIAYANGTTPVSGLALLINPVVPTTLWAATYTAGVFKTTDGAATWMPIAGSPDILYAFAGDPAGSQPLYAAGYGVFRSTDSGANWSTTGLAFAASTHALDVDPTNPATLYLATSGEGVFKSTDRGHTWSRKSAGLAPLYLYDVEIQPGTPSLLYAGSDAGVFRSTDASDSWHRTELSGLTRALAAAPTDPPTIFADSFLAALGVALFRSTDSGETWQPSDLDAAPLSGVVVDPHDPRRLYIGTGHSYGVSDGGIWTSSDAGVHWMATALKSFDGVNPLAVDPQSSDVVYAGYGAGLLKSTDGGRRWRAMNNGLPEGGVGEMVFDPVDPRLMYVSAGDVLASTDAAATWSVLGGGLDDAALALAIDPVDGTTLYAGTDRGVFVLQRTDLDPMRTAALTPTPTPTVDPRCPPDQITLVPSAAPPGTRVMLNGECYFLHSGRQAAVYFDTAAVGEVTGDTAGNYALEFNVPIDLLPGSYLVRVVGAQSARFDVLPSTGTPTPTVTPSQPTFCPAENMTVVPNIGPPGTRIVVSGQCYFIHSGGQGEIYFDDAQLGFVRGDTPGNYAAGFVVPANAPPGPHVVRLEANSSTDQSAVFEVELAPPTLSPTSTATVSPTPSATRTPPGALSSTMSGGGGCALAPIECDPAALLILLCVPAALLSESLVHKRKRVTATSTQGGKGS
jgi:photosystem II stability/assembly factor-like uncharacterized protein